MDHVSILRGPASRAFRWSSRPPHTASDTALCGHRRANLAGDAGRPFFGFIFDPAAERQPDPVDLRGGARSPRRFIGWQTFFDFGGDQSANAAAQEYRHEDLEPVVQSAAWGDCEWRSAHRAPATEPAAPPDLVVAIGQAIAQAMREPMLSRRELSELADFGVGFESDTPLWYYVLKEAELSGGPGSSVSEPESSGKCFSAC